MKSHNVVPTSSLVTLMGLTPSVVDDAGSVAAEGSSPTFPEAVH
jgi:hypothetical protein